MTSVDGPFRLVAALMACTAVAGCLGSGGGGAGGGTGGGGGGGGATTIAQHDAAFDRVKGLIPTSDMPTTGTANFAGTVKTVLNKGTNPIGTLLGDLEMAIDFGAADKTKAITGSATNFHGTVNGKDETYTGTLTTANAAAKSLPSTLAIDERTITPPVGGPVTVRTGSIMANMSGDLTVGGKSGTVLLTTGGTFFGPGGQAISGPALGTWWGPAGPSEYTVGGTVVMERK